MGHFFFTACIARATNSAHARTVPMNPYVLAETRDLCLQPFRLSLASKELLFIFGLPSRCRGRSIYHGFGLYPSKSEFACVWTISRAYLSLYIVWCRRQTFFTHLLHSSPTWRPTNRQSMTSLTLRPCVWATTCMWVVNGGQFLFGRVDRKMSSMSTLPCLILGTQWILQFVRLAS